MIAAAKDGQWDVVVDIELKREPHLLLLDGFLNSVGENSEIINFFRKIAIFIIDSDQEIAKLAESHKVYLQEESSDLDASRKAVNAYLDNVYI